MVLPAILKSISPDLVDRLKALLDQLKETAKSTPNPWDDILVVFLEDLMTDIIRERG
jgi:hypothetical protein